MQCVIVLFSDHTHFLKKSEFEFLVTVTILWLFLKNAMDWSVVCDSSIS